jgi:hypothetical protein
MSLPICWSFRGGGGTAGVDAACGAAAGGCSAGWFLQPDPSTRNPAKTASGMPRRIRESVFIGEILGFRLLLYLLSFLTKQTWNRLARCARILHLIIVNEQSVAWQSIFR